MIVLEPGRLSAVGDAELDDLTVARQCVLAIGEGEVRGAAAAALLLADFAAMAVGSTIVLDSPAGWAGAVWRIGSDALKIAWGGERTSRSASRRTSTSGGSTIGSPPLAGSGDPSPGGRGRRLSIPADQARDWGLADELFSGDWTLWLERWLAHRSAVALDSAAVLIGRRGGDPLERAEFARLFATGEPQHGMEAFLGKRKPRFSGRIED